MASMELKKATAEKARVYSSRLDLELKIEEFKEQTQRVLEHIAVQMAKEAELDKKIAQLTESEK